MNLFGEDWSSTTAKKKPKQRSKRQNAKNKVLPHTQAKLDLYNEYLKVYLSVLMKADRINRINLYDVYCGNGKYDDGKPGSPVIALSCVKQVQADFASKGWNRKPIRLSVNDGKKKRYESVKAILEAENNGACTIDCHNLLGEAMLQKVSDEVRLSNGAERNLIFIDPYGYKEIHKTTIKQLMDSGNTEIYLFLPIAQMHRFSPTALKRVNNPSYDPLRRFIGEFMPSYDFSQKPTPDKVFAFINSITTALTFNGQYFACSHYIQRDVAGNYYGIFFVTKHLYGLDKMLNAKWSMDKNNGQGFRLPSKDPLQQSVFDFLNINTHQDDLAKHEQFLTASILEYLADGLPKGNRELYPFLLKLGYLSKHATPILKKLCVEKKLEYTCSTNTKTPAFYLNWDDHRLPSDKCKIRLIS